MRTARQLFKTGITLCGFTSGDDSTRGFSEQEIQSIIDEAIAHGMTISAEIARDYPYASAEDIECIVLTARDNKVWRKE